MIKSRGSRFCDSNHCLRAIRNASVIIAVTSQTKSVANCNGLLANANVTVACRPTMIGERQLSSMSGTGSVDRRRNTFATTRLQRRPRKPNARCALPTWPWMSA